MKIIKPGWVHHDSEPIYSIDIHPDATRFVTSGSRCGKICIWNMEVIRNSDLESNDKVHKLLCMMEQHLGCVNCVRWSSDGLYLASGSDDKFVIIWKRIDQQKTRNFNENWRCVNTLRGHDGDVLHVAWSPKDKYLASCSVDNSIIIWNALKFPEKLATIKAHTGFVKGITWDPLGHYIASQSDDRTLRIFSVTDWKEVTNITKPFKETTSTTHSLRLDWSPDGAQIVSAHSMNNGGPTAQIIKRSTWETDLDFVGHRKAVTVVRFKKEQFKGNYCVLGIGSRDRSVSIWRTDYSRAVCVMHDLFNQSVVDITWSTGKHKDMACCSLDGTVAFFIFTSDEIGKPLVVKGTCLVVEKITKQIDEKSMNKIPDIKSNLSSHDSMLSSGSTNFARKQIERHTAEGRRRITPVLLSKHGDTGQQFDQQPMFSTTTESTKIVVERRNSITKQSPRNIVKQFDDESNQQGYKRFKHEHELPKTVIVAKSIYSVLKPATFNDYDIGNWKVKEATIYANGSFFVTKFVNKFSCEERNFCTSSKLITLLKICDSSDLFISFFLNGQCCLWNILSESRLWLPYCLCAPIHFGTLTKSNNVLLILDITGAIFVLNVHIEIDGEFILSVSRKIDAAHLFVNQEKKCEQLELLLNGDILLKMVDGSRFIHNSKSNLWQATIENDSLAESNRFSLFYREPPTSKSHKYVRHLATLADLQRTLQYCLHSENREVYVFTFNCYITELVLFKKESTLKSYVNRTIVPFSSKFLPIESRIIKQIGVDRRMLLACVLKILNEFESMPDVYSYFKELFDGNNLLDDENSDENSFRDTETVNENIRMVKKFLKTGWIPFEQLKKETTKFTNYNNDNIVNELLSEIIDTCIIENNVN